MLRSLFFSLLVLLSPVSGQDLASFSTTYTTDIHTNTLGEVGGLAYLNGWGPYAVTTPLLDGATLNYVGFSAKCETGGYHHIGLVKSTVTVQGAPFYDIDYGFYCRLDDVRPMYSGSEKPNTPNTGAEIFEVRFDVASSTVEYLKDGTVFHSEPLLADFATTSFFLMYDRTLDAKSMTEVTWTTGGKHPSSSNGACCRSRENRSSFVLLE